MTREYRSAWFHRIRAWAWLGSFALGLTAGAPAPSAIAAQGAVALVLDVEGATTPMVTPYSELSNRSTISLRPDGQMSFVHYGACRMVTVKGGRLYVDARRYSLAGGQIVSEDKTDCPREQKLAAADGGAAVAAGVLMRGAGGAPHLTPHPRIVLTGSKGGMLHTAELRKAGQALGSMTVHEHLASWPAGRPALAPGTDYVVHLASVDGKVVVDFQFSVAEPGMPGEAAAILRLD